MNWTILQNVSLFIWVMWAILGFPVSKWTFADSKNLIPEPHWGWSAWQEGTPNTSRVFDSFFLVKQNPKHQQYLKKSIGKPHEVEDRNLRIHHLKKTVMFFRLNDNITFFSRSQTWKISWGPESRPWTQSNWSLDPPCSGLVLWLFGCFGGQKNILNYTDSI